MENNVQKEEGISLMEIVRLLLSKIKILILVVLIGGLLGGVFSFFRTVDTNYWGTTIEFYVNPEKPKATVGDNGGSQYGVYGAYGRHVMDNMVKLLGSESFTEKLILDGKPVPEKGEWVNEKDEEEVSLGLDALIDAANVEIAKYEAEQTKVNDALVLRNEKVVAYNTAADKVQEEWEILFETVSELNLTTKTFNELQYIKTVKDHSSATEINKAYEEMIKAEDEVLAAQDELTLAQQNAELAKGPADEATETALEAWRKTSKYRSYLSKYSDSISFSYLRSDEDVEDANNLARSFIYVEISVLDASKKEAPEFATELRERVLTVVPSYVEANMAVPADYEGTNCQRTTRSDEIFLTNPDYTTQQVILFALIVAVAALVVASIVIVIIDKSDKRLRDVEVVTKKFNIPVLGIVPTIEELTAESNAKKKGAKKADKEAK